MSTHATLDLRSLEQLRAVSIEMVAFAERGDWDAVLKSDAQRLQILQQRNDNGVEAATQPIRKIMVDEILDLDRKIRELAGNERQLVLDKEIRKQAQVTAQTRYKQALNPGIGL